MNDKDLEAFYKWVEIEFGEIQDHQRAYMYEKSIFRFACEYKQKEIEDLYKHLKHEHDLYRKHLKVYEDEILEYKEAARSEAQEVNRLQAENKKLRKALNDWVQWENGQILMNGEYSGEDINRLINKAREALKEIKE